MGAEGDVASRNKFAINDILLCRTRYYWSYQAAVDAREKMRMGYEEGHEADELLQLINSTDMNKVQGLAELRQMLEVSKRKVGLAFVLVPYTLC